MNNRETMQQALEALEAVYLSLQLPDLLKVVGPITALRTALAVPVQEPVAHPVIAGALFDFMGWLTCRKERLVLSSVDDASPAVVAITEFAKMRSLSLDGARVLDWQDNTTPPQRPWVGLTEEEVQFYIKKHSKLVNAGYDKMTDTNLVARTFDSTGFYKEVSAVLKERNG